MTGERFPKARSLAGSQQAGFPYVRFEQGYIDDVPAETGSADSRTRRRAAFRASVDTGPRGVSGTG